ncbi:MAG: TIGR04282 family arsenosugar biosynthesis glycosyltransferase [Flavobacterium sp.]|nr:TIGR04282 family arsenosugar biosynthesis glycosyltransferase [Flavobacterium sp.]
MFENQILIFTRNPELGKVKTRLAATIGDQNALEIYEILLNHTEKIINPINVTKTVMYSEEIITDDIWDNEKYDKKVQFGQDLGAKMKNAVAGALENDYKKVVVIGSDLYDLQESDITTAFEKLDKFDVVLGPASDGGYYLLGLKFIPDNIFFNKKWGTSSVLKDTLTDLENFNIYLLDIKNDIDTFNDIKDIENFQKFI